MTDRPILFSAPMVRALLEGRKTQTRRLVKSPLRNAKPRDLLWVRETWGNCLHRSGIFFAADGPMPMQESNRWRSPIHMPRWASRLTLLVTEARVQPLHAITKFDARREGTQGLHSFAALWDELHGPGAWHSNPEVVALSFVVLKINIDKVDRAKLGEGKIACQG